MSTQKRKGTRHETAVVNYLTAQGFNARRVVQTGRLDQGDIHAEGIVCIEAKDHAKHDFPGWIKQANKEAANAGLPFGVVVAKKRNANIKDAYVVMDLEMFSRVLAALRGN